MAVALIKIVEMISALAVKLYTKGDYIYVRKIKILFFQAQRIVCAVKCLNISKEMLFQNMESNRREK